MNSKDDCAGRSGEVWADLRPIYEITTIGNNEGLYMGDNRERENKVPPAFLDLIIQNKFGAIFYWKRNKFGVWRCVRYQSL